MVHSDAEITMYLITSLRRFAAQSYSIPPLQTKRIAAV